MAPLILSIPAVVQELVEASAAALEHQVSEAQLQAEAQKAAYEEVGSVGAGVYGVMGCTPR